MSPTCRDVSARCVGCRSILARWACRADTKLKMSSQKMSALANIFQIFESAYVEIYYMVYFYIRTAHNHNTHTTTKMKKISPCRPTLQRLWPSPSMGRSAAPPTLGADHLHCRTEAASCRGCARCRWFACLGWFGHFFRKTERGAGSWP